MVKILVLGATGYIGYPLVQSLRKDGHSVWGLARTEDKAHTLLKAEIVPVFGTIEGGEYLEVVKTANIDMVIDAAGANQGSYAVLAGLKSLSEQRLQQRGRHGPKLGFIYLGGTWVHGSSKDAVNDLNPVGVIGDAGCPTIAPDLVAWRPKLENAILDAREVLDSIIIRPALLYGGQASLWSLWLGPINEAVSNSTGKESHIPADAAAQPGLIHVDDVVSGVHLAVNNFELVSSASGTYPVFDLVTSSEPLKPILDSAAHSLGYSGKLVYDGPGDDAFATAMNTSMRGSSTRARDLLGWVPKHTSMGEEIEIFVRAWKARL